MHAATLRGAWAWGFVAYEAAPALDPTLAAPHRCTVPLVWFGLSGPPSREPSLPPQPAGDGAARWSRGWTSEGYRGDVAEVRRRIAAGDTYQCNLTARLHGEVPDARALYQHLLAGQRTAYAAHVSTGSHEVVSGSPELFLRRAGERVLMRPMKGTAARGRFRSEDDVAARSLVSSSKERAENVMIVDLLRNDLSRVALQGSVIVPTMLRVERYGTVWQLTSDVEAVVAPEVTLTELLRALFPCGSVTGAPKARTTEVIAGLEGEARGVYCGAIGWVAPPDEPVRAQLSVGIRTAVVERATGRAGYGTGSGITWGSVAEDEEAELVAKTAVLLGRPSGEALLETLRHEPGVGVLRLERHLRRLAWSAEVLGFAVDLDAVRARLAGLGSAGPARVRLVVQRDGAVDVAVSPAPQPAGRPVRVELCRRPVSSTDVRLFHKTTDRAVYDERLAHHPDADDVVLTNERGEVTESSIANVAVRLDGSWWTPPLDAGCLPGTLREELLERQELTERVLSVDDVARADALALVSSLRGWRAAVLVGDPGRRGGAPCA